ncbi:unnamed protein product, partial [Hymenolepis diminuta]
YTYKLKLLKGISRAIEYSGKCGYDTDTNGAGAGVSAEGSHPMSLVLIVLTIIHLLETLSSPQLLLSHYFGRSLANFGDNLY